MTIAVIDYGSGNLRSAAKACERAAADIGIGDSVVVTSRPEEILAADPPAGTHVCFVHGLELYPSEPANVLAETDSGGPIVAAVGRDNLIGTQFHPDKSQGAGLLFIANFLRWRP